LIRWISSSECRDPFSGDCDLENLERTIYRMSIVGVPRPVFRGLRQVCASVYPSNPGAGCRSAETRFQGIATRLSRQDYGWIKVMSECRDPFSGDCDFIDRTPYHHSGFVGVPRPVFRGLRP